MNMKATIPVVAGVLLCGLLPAGAAQPAADRSHCAVTPAQLEVNKKAAMAFFRQGITPQERIALLDPGYIQHNPRFVKAAAQDHISAYEEFKQMFARMGGPRPPGSPGGPGAAAGARPPMGNPLELVIAECDLVTLIHKDYRQDPGAAPGTYYEAFGFDTFRVRNGKLVEHWDGALLDAPAQSGPPAGPPRN